MTERKVGDHVWIGNSLKEMVVYAENGIKKLKSVECFPNGHPKEYNGALSYYEEGFWGGIKRG